MNRVVLFLMGAFAAVTFAAFVLVAIPQFELPIAPDVWLPTDFSPGHIPLKPYSAAEERGRAVYIANGCIYCHSQQIRDPTFTNDVDRGWGTRPSYPSDYVYDRPALLGTMRTGPDLINVGARLPDRNWQLLHLFQPRAVNSWSIMPSFRFLFRIKDQPGERDVIVQVPKPFAPKGKVVVASQEALDLVSYLLSLKRNFEPPELRRDGGRQSQ